MKYAIVGSLTALLAGAGLAMAQQPAEGLPAPRPYTAAGRDVPADQAGPGVSFLPGPGPGAPGPDGNGPTPGFIPAVAIDGVPYHYWFEADYLLWFLSKDHLPPVLTAGTLQSGGILGEPGTTVLVGGDSLDRSQRSGARFTIGGWATDYHGFGLELSYFMLEGASRNFSASGTGATGTTVLGRPFFNILTGREDAFAVAIPGTESGSATVTTAGIHCDNGRLQGAEAHFIGNICADPECRFDFLVGYRWLSLNDHFAMEQDSLIGPSIFNNFNSSSFSIQDRFDSGNRFNGAQIGLRGEWRGERLSVRADAKVAIGASDESISVGGQTLTFAPGVPPLVLPGGFLATQGNSGSFNTTQFAVVPEVNVRVGYQVCDWMKLTVGYDLLYWSNVARAGDQIPHAINTLAVPAISPLNSFATQQPLGLIRCTDFWAHGLTAGLELRF